MSYSSPSLPSDDDVSKIRLPRRFRNRFRGVNDGPSLFAGRFVRGRPLEHTNSSWLDDSTSDDVHEFDDDDTDD